MNVDVNDPEAVAVARSMFPGAEIRPYTLGHRLVRRLNQILHRIGLHDFVPTYIVEDVEGGHRAVRQYLCSICHQPGSPAEELR